MADEDIFAGPPGLPERYRILGLLGQGGFASVVKALDTTTGTTVALKILHAQHLGDSKRCRRFEREIRVCQRLNHPHVIKVKAAVVSTSMAYLVMEYLDAKNLSLLLKEKTLALDEAYRIVAQVASALAYIHRSKLVHRDIKPENIMVGAGLRVVLTDFNLVRLPYRTSLSGAGDALGTPLYVAPEVVMGDDATPSADLYAMGLTFFELLTGSQPYRQKGLGALLKAIVEADVPRPSSINPLVPPAVDAMVARCTAKDPDKRYPDAATFLRDLAKVGPAARAAVDAVAPVTPGLDQVGSSWARLRAWLSGLLGR